MLERNLSFQKYFNDFIIFDKIYYKMNQSLFELGLNGQKEQSYLTAS